MLRKSKIPSDSGASPSAPDAGLVLAARRGDKRAFVEIVARHQAMVCGIALGILNDFAASEDAGQEAFLTAWRKLHELREPERLRPWLAQIARNAALGQLRSRRSHDAISEDLELVDESPTPDETTATEEESALVREYLAKLPENYRSPLILYYREGKSVSAVAEVLGISEDAAKQRLARGREMLRERMHGTIETVLTRTRPNAIFTMGIAVAIGALAAPAAVAGTAFAASSAAAASASTASTNLFAAMSTTKAFLVTTAAVAILCIPIGYNIGNGISGRESTRPLPNAENSVKVPVRAAADFQNSELFVEWRKLHEQYGTNAEAMPAIYKAIGAITNAFRRDSFRAALMSEWVQLDPNGGFTFMLGKGRDGVQRRQFFEEWLALDSKSAVSALLHAGAGWDDLARDSLSAIARHSPESLADVASRLSAGHYWDNSVQEAFSIFADSSFRGAREAAETVAGPNRDQALAGVAKVWGKSEFDAAVAWARALPDGVDRNEVIRAALIGRAEVDPIGALQSAEIVPPGGRNTYFASTTGAKVLAEAARTDFDSTVAWLAANPGRFNREDLMGLVQPVTEHLNDDATGFLNTLVSKGSLAAIVPAINNAMLNSAGGQRAAIWDWLKGQRPSDAIKSMKDEVVNSAAWQDPQFALGLVTDFPAGSEGDALLKSLSRDIFNGGTMLGRFDWAFQNAPERLRQPLVEQAFEFLRTEGLDPQVWVSRLQLLPEASRPKAEESLAGAWARQDPEDAISWASSLTPGDAQNSAFAAIATSWGKTDAQAAADWLSSLPGGAQRDSGARAFAVAIANQFPREAWDWALSINDAAQRGEAAMATAKVIAARDLTTARQWIESASLPSDTKAEILSALNKPSSR